MGESENNLYQQTLGFLRKHDLLSRQIYVAYSGGVDSQALLHTLACIKADGYLQANLRAIHVHHGLSAYADNWLEFTKQQAFTFGVEYQGVQVNVQEKPQQSLEALARDARYQAFKEYSDENAVIVTAHHQDDQLETLLLALKRGSGISGLGAMSEVRKFNAGRLIARPFLNVSRAEIERYASDKKLEWIEDESNADERFDRNFLRHQVIPLLQQRWPHILESVSRSTRHLREGQQLLEQTAEQDMQLAQFSEQSLAIEPLLSLTKPRLKKCIAVVCKTSG